MLSNITNYTRAYTEVNCLLKYMPESYIIKLPKKLLELIKDQSSDEFNIEIDPTKSLLEQNFSKKTKDLITVINYSYWATDEEKEYLQSIFYENEKKYQKELQDKHNSDDIFNKKRQNTEVAQSMASDTQLILYKENIFTKILNKVKSFLFKK